MKYQLGDKIKQIRESKGFSQKEFAKLIGVSNSRLSNWELGINRPDVDNLSSICKALDISADSLLEFTPSIPESMDMIEIGLIKKYRALDEHGKQVVDAVLDLEHSRMISESTNGDYLYLNFPFFPVSAGTGVYLDGDGSGTLKVPATHKNRRANYALRVSGDSMQPDYLDGDILLVETKPELQDGELGIFIVNGEGYFKKIIGNTLVSLNSDYAPIDLSEFDDVKVLGRVIGKV